MINILVVAIFFCLSACAQTNLDPDERYAAEIRRAYADVFGGNPKAGAECPTPAPVKRTARSAVAPTTKPTPAPPALPPIGWPDWLMWLLSGTVAVLALVVAFLLGRVTGQPHQPQMVAPVVYVQPPEVPRVVRP